MTNISGITNNNQFHIYETDESITIMFSSTMDNIDRTCEEAKRFLTNFFKRLQSFKYYNFEFQENSLKLKSHLFAIQLVMREGLTNAVRHGNCFNANKTVRCYLTINQHQMLIMEIEDQGDGFNWRKEQSKDIEDVDSDSDHGRGLMIMEQYFSRYWYNERGNKLTLEKNMSI